MGQPLEAAAVERLGFGGDYNPDHWPAAVWQEDLRLMKEAAVNLVSVGIFSWANVEPRPGTYDFGWFDAVMDGLAGAGVSACLATMTASPPPWLSTAHPETLPQRADGVRLWPGARQHYCPSSPVYRSFAGRLVRTLAERYGDHPALTLWHIGNEYGCHVSTCYCDVSAEAFRSWLRARYGTLDALNDAWSTTFWSQRYGDWAEILPPRTAPTFPNPAQQIDFRRFSSDELLACYRMERDILREVTPGIPATTNLLGIVPQVDYFAWAPHVDVVSHDSYPDPHDPDSHILAALTYDLMRSLGHGQPWLLMEQAPSAVNWRPRNGPKAPGVMRLWSYQAVARGADAVMYFQWRQSLGGAEKFHSAMVPAAGEQTRTFRAVRQLGQELAELPVTHSRVRADVAILLDWSSWWGLELDSHPAELSFVDALLAHYRPLWNSNLTCDVVHPSWDLTAYRLVVVPNLYLVSAADAARLASYVEAGGHVFVSFFSGIVDEHDRLHPGGHPGPLGDLLGLRIDEFWPLPDGGSIGLSLDGGASGVGTEWSEWIDLAGGETVATFTDGDLAGRPAVVRHAYGTGMAWYVGTRPDGSTMDSLLRRAAAEAGAEPVVPGLPPGVEAVARHAADGTRYLFLLNHTDSAVDHPVRLEPRGVAVCTSS